ncbi:hypothetical protein GGF44_005461, partial [Coemansia sp. RSA 1694]
PAASSLVPRRRLSPRRAAKLSAGRGAADEMPLRSVQEHALAVHVVLQSMEHSHGYRHFRAYQGL